MQLDEVLDEPSGRHAQGPADADPGYGDALNGAPERGRGRRPGSGQPRRDRRAVAQRLARVRAGRAARHRARERGDARQEAHDLSRLIAGHAEGRRRAVVERREPQGPRHELQHDDGRVRRRAARTCAARSRSCRACSSSPTPRSRTSNTAFPPTRAFAREILPGVRETAPTIDAAFPWIRQTRALVSPAELQGLVNDLQPAVSDLAVASSTTRSTCCRRSTS